MYDARVINNQLDVELSIGNRVVILTLIEAVSIAQKLLMAVNEQPLIPGSHKWLIIAGQQNGQVVDRSAGTFDDLMRRAKAMAYIHKAAVWAVSYTRITSVLAWPRFATFDGDMELAAIRNFVHRVNAQAERNIEKTGQLEGAHHAAMQSELRKMERDSKRKE